jgi:hypothetical protein
MVLTESSHNILQKKSVFDISQCHGFSQQFVIENGKGKPICCTYNIYYLGIQFVSQGVLRIMNFSMNHHTIIIKFIFFINTEETPWNY